ncbi:SDR family oxidoreductase [Jeotgalibacillus campisalis]|uniref:NAD dependent epimerase/dehydratase n=1 Tax=Jeotgalibacillus campisalis TaxID=220754 RepID=A0A0C2R032_9BACL|nr:SDR family oxidoreductase [Jeotgalibacillus campisalis]KIL43675.1 NAD dependent epimerase/dehydratase [Jeotgalibacillus campisalis]
MHVLVIGANGTTGTMVVEKLAKSEQHLVKAMIRKTEQASKMEELGARPIIADLESEFDYALEDVNAVIFAAGSGPDTGADKTTAVDEEGAKKAVDYAKEKGIERFIMLSSVGADDPSVASDNETFHHYLQAKHNADEHLKQSGLDYTIVRPVGLEDEPAKGKITASKSLANKKGTITREDVATVLVESLLIDGLKNMSIEIENSDESDIVPALEKL